MKQSVYLAASPGFIAIASTLYGSLVLSLWHCNLPYWLLVAAPVPIIYDWWWVLRVFGLRSHKHAVAMILQDCDQWQYKLANGRTFKGTLVPDRSFVGKFCLVLRIQHRYGGRYIIVPRDSVSKHNYRNLAFALNAS